VKYLKMLSLAAVTAAALMALVGVGSASAAVTTGCHAKEGTEAAPTCSEANMVTNGTQISAKLSSAEAKLEAGIATVKCTASELGGKQETTENPEGKLETLTFSSCNFPVNTIEKGKLKVAHSTAWNASLVAEGVKVEVVISGSIKCFYGGTINTGLTAVGGAPAHAKAVNAEIPRLAGSSTSCANPAKWNAEYEVTAPNPLFISVM
jgi:hypothetical protein